MDMVLLSGNRPIYGYRYSLEAWASGGPGRDWVARLDDSVSGPRPADASPTKNKCATVDKFVSSLPLSLWVVVDAGNPYSTRELGTRH